MKAKLEPTVLVLGATGMLGRVVYLYLKKNHPKNTYGTVRKKSVRFLYLDAANKKSVNNVFLKVKPNYVVNCIGVLQNGKEDDFKSVNIAFPKTLETLSKRFKFKIISISSDAVYFPTSKTVFENSKTNPIGEYAKSKLEGETKTSTLNIRTSVLGLDPKEHKGLLEYALKNKTDIVGFTNQTWTGATTLQISRFIDDIIYSELNSLFQKTSVVNFAPLGPISKYEILQIFANQTLKQSVKKGKSDIHTTKLKSKYLDEDTISKYNMSLTESLKEILSFDKSYAKTFKKS